MSHALTPLLKLRQLREQAAAQRLSERRWRLERAVRRRDDTRRELDEFRRWRAAEEIELFAELQAKPVRVGEIDDFNNNLVTLEQRETEMVTALADAESAIQETQQQLNAAQRTWADAVRAQEKLVELIRAGQADLALAEERKADWEMEEATAVLSRSSS